MYHIESVMKGAVPMEWVRAINSAIEYMEEHLPGDPTAPDYVSEICIPVKSN